MQRQRFVFLVAFLVIALLTVLLHAASLPIAAQQPLTATPAMPPSLTTPDSAFRSSPVMFIENASQWDSRARFQVWGGQAGTMWLAEDAIWITVMEPWRRGAAAREQGSSPVRIDSPLSSGSAAPLPSTGANIRLSFVDANPHPRIEPFDRLDTKVSYFLGNDPDQWRPDVPVWGGVRYVDLYPGVDLEITSEGGQWSWETVQRVAALSLSPSQGEDRGEGLRLRVEGADAVTVDGDTLHLSTAAGEAVLPLLLAEGLGGEAAVQALGAQIFNVGAPFASARFDSAIYNPQADGLLYGTFLGGSKSDAGLGIAVDGTGSAYVTGWTKSSDFPTTPGVFDPNYNGGDCGSTLCVDVIVIKLNPTGSGLTYATFLGGSDSDVGRAIAVNGLGSAYVTGYTKSRDFPTTSGAFDPSYHGYEDVFVVKLNPTGSGLSYATFLGGSNSAWDEGRAIALDGAGSAYVTGFTESSDFPTTPGAFDTSFNGGYNYGDAFVVKLNPAGSGLTYATFLGGSDQDGGYAIAIDATGCAYVTGWTESSDFPTTSGAFDTSSNGSSDAFVVKLNPAGSGLAFATFVGGWVGDRGEAIAVDGTGSAYLTGYTGSNDFPATLGAFDPSINGNGYDAFVVKLNPTGDGLVYATFLGGGSNDVGEAIAVDRGGNAYVTGYTESSDFPTTLGAFDRNYDRQDDFTARLSPAGSELAYATFLGGSSYDYGGSAVAMDGVGSVYVTGQTDSSDFPTTAGALDRSHNGYSDVFVVKLAMASSGTLGVGVSCVRSYWTGDHPTVDYDPAPGAPVELRDSAGGLLASGITDSNGKYGLCQLGIPAGQNYQLTVCWQGTCESVTIDISGGQCLLYDFNLDALCIEPTSTPTPTATPIATSTPMPTATPTSTATATSHGTSTATPTGTLTSTPITAPTRPFFTPTATPDFPTCSVTVDKLAYPATARKDVQIGVTLRLTGNCTSEVGAAVDAALVIDRSASMCGDKLTQAQAAGQAFLDSMAFPPDQASIISFASTAQLNTGLTGNRQQATNALNSIACGGLSRIDAGLNKAYDELTGSRRVAGHTPALILLTDGNPEGAYAADVRVAAQRVRDAGILLYTIGLGPDVNAALLREIATQPDYYFQSPTPADLALIYARLAGDLRGVPGANLLLTDIVAPDFEIVPGSFAGAAQPQVLGDTLRWYLPRLPVGVTEVSFNVRPKQCGTFFVNQSATVDYDDNRGTRRSLIFPAPTVTVTSCGPDLTDVFIRDNPSDTGSIPSTAPWWESPDIWVRQADDGGTQHQNPQAGQRNYLYARIWNRGTTTVANIDVSFFYANPGLGLTWPADWRSLAPVRQIASLAPGQSAVVSIPWDVPSLAGHWCLLVHISAPVDLIQDNRVEWDNNIAQRNLHIIEYPQPPPGACLLDNSGLQTDRIAFEVINVLATASLVDLRIEVSNLEAGAQVRFEPGALASRWASLDGLVVDGDGRLRVTRFPAMIYGVQLNPSERRTVFIEVKAPGNSRFTVGLTELVRGNIVGGNAYQRWLPPCPTYLPIIMKPAPGPTPCPPGQYTPPDVMLVLDRSGSMSGAKLDAAKQAVGVFLDQMDLSQEQAGIASFDQSAALNQALTQSRSTLNAALNAIVVGGNTAIGEGIAVAQTELQSARHRPDHTPAMIVLSDGQNNAGRNPITAAAAAKAAGTVIFTVGLGSDADANLLRQIASDPAYYYYAPTPDKLAEIYRTIAGEIRCRP